MNWENIGKAFILVVFGLLLLVVLDRDSARKEICELEIEGKFNGEFERINLNLEDDSYNIQLKEIEGKIKVKCPCYLLNEISKNGLKIKD